MCDPTVLAVASIASTVASGAMSAYGQMQQGKAAQEQANYQAAIQRNNAAAQRNNSAIQRNNAVVQQNNAARAEQLAGDALARGKQAESQERLRGRLLIGQMRAALASSGQVIDQDSAGELVIDQAGINEVDALNVRTNAQREAQDLRIKGQNFGVDAENFRINARSSDIQARSMESGADLTQIAGANKRSSASTAAAGTLLSTGGSVASKWYKFDQAGVF